MKESYHTCFTSHSEVLFRNDEDHRMFVNLLALAAFRNDAEVLADAEMSTHVHLNVFTNEPVAFASTLRQSYTKWFNRRYGREGRFGEKGFYLLRIEGHYHQMVAENYILRNGLHHGVAPTAFAYPYCSVRELFSEDLGFPTAPMGTYSKGEMAFFLPRHAEFPDEYEMDENGMITRRSFMEIRKAEQYYVTPRNYLYQMNRLTDESWLKEQAADNCDQKPVTLADIEQAEDNAVSRMLKNENARGFNKSIMQDLDVCKLIDGNYLGSAPSVYVMTESQRERIFRALLYEHRLPEKQIRRCLAMPPI